MNKTSMLIQQLVSRLPDTFVLESRMTKPMVRSKVQIDPELTALRQRLNSIRNESMEACRRGDFRAQGRLTVQTADILRQIRAVEGLPEISEAEMR